MSLHGRGTEGERTLPLPAAGAPPLQAGPGTPPIWSPPPPLPAYPGPYSNPGPYSGGGGSWQPPGGPVPTPPNRGRAALAVVAVVLAVVLFVVAVSYAVVGGAQHAQVAMTPPSPSATPSPSPSDAVLVPPATPAPTAAAPSVPPTTPAPLASSNVLTPAAIAATVDPSVVDVNAILSFQGGTAAGTGMILTSTGAILTNNHVIDGATQISVQIAGTGRSYAATLVNTDPAEDVAVLQLQGASGLRVAPFGDSARVALGDRVVALGNALGRAGPPSVSQGLVVGLNRDITATDPTAGTSENLTGLIQTSASLQPGDSGGPLINAAGQVIGMDTAASQRVRFNSGGGVGFAIPINHALQVAASLRAGGRPVQSPVPPSSSRGFLGVQVQQNTTGPGAIVGGIVAGGPAEAAGIAIGDSIVAVNGQTVTSPNSLTAILQATHPGDTVRVSWLDGLQRRHSAIIRLVANPSLP